MRMRRATAAAARALTVRRGCACRGNLAGACVPRRVPSLTLGQWATGCHVVGAAIAGGGLGKGAGRTKRSGSGLRATLPGSTILNACSTTEIHAAITIQFFLPNSDRQPTTDDACPPHRSLSASQPLRRRLGPGLRLREVRTALARRCLRVASLRPRRHALCPRRAQRRAPQQRAPWLQRLLPGHPDARTSTTARTRLSLQG